MKGTAHLQTPAIKKKRAAAIRAAWARKRSEATAAPPTGKAPVIVYEGDRRPAKRQPEEKRLELAGQLLSVMAEILGVR